MDTILHLGIGVSLSLTMISLDTTDNIIETQKVIQ